MTSLPELLESRRDVLLRRWLERVRHAHAPEGLSRPALADHIPHFLDALVAALRREEEGGADKAHRVAPFGWEHGRQRLQVGFALKAMVREYGELHEEILTLADEAGVRVDPDAQRVLVRCFTFAVAEAVAQYTHQAHTPHVSPPAP